jgi:hypothetical protein
VAWRDDAQALLNDRRLPNTFSRSFGESHASKYIFRYIGVSLRDVWLCALFSCSAIDRGIVSYPSPLQRDIPSACSPPSLPPSLPPVVMDYPNYYTQPFHAYEDGNLNWLAAAEVESATSAMCLRVGREGSVRLEGRLLL